VSASCFSLSVLGTTPLSTFCARALSACFIVFLVYAADKGKWGEIALKAQSPLFELSRMKRALPAAERALS